MKSDPYPTARRRTEPGVRRSRRQSAHMCKNAVPENRVAFPCNANALSHRLRPAHAPNEISEHILAPMRGLTPGCPTLNLITNPRSKVLAGSAVVAVLSVVTWHFWDLPKSNSASEPAKIPGQIVPTTELVTTGTSATVPPVHTERSENWHFIARQTDLQVVSASLTIHEDVIKLLGLSSAQAQHLNEMLASFVERLRSEEISHAYVSVSRAGEEEIVVPGFPVFDRTDILTRFRDEVASKLGADIGAFIAEEISWDNTLAVGNFELRLRVERGDDALDRLVVTREVRAPEQWGSLSVTPDGFKVNHGATVRMTATSILQLGIDPRYTHLLSAMQTLPKHPLTK